MAMPQCSKATGTLVPHAWICTSAGWSRNSDSAVRARVNCAPASSMCSLAHAHNAADMRDSDTDEESEETAVDEDGDVDAAVDASAAADALALVEALSAKAVDNADVEDGAGLTVSVAAGTLAVKHRRLARGSR